MVMDDPTLPRIKVRDLLMQAFLTGWSPVGTSRFPGRISAKLHSGDRDAPGGAGEPVCRGGPPLPDGEEVDHLDDLLRADGVWLYYGVEAENFLP